MEEFEREEIRPSFRIGFSLDDLEESSFEGELCFDNMDRDELELDSVEEADEDEEEDEEED